MNLHYRTPLNPGADSFTRKDVNRDKVVTSAPHITGNFYRNDKRSHDQVWPERREESMTRFASRVIKFVEPIGYVGPMQDALDIRELTASQCIVHKREHRMGPECITADLAPEWLRLQANGVDCVSMYSEYTDEDGNTYEVGVEAAERMASEAIAQTLDANIEEFLRKADEQRWYSGRPRVAVEVASADGKRGVSPKPGHPFTHEELKAIAKKIRHSAEQILAIKELRSNPKWLRKRSLEGLRALMTPAEMAAMRDFEPIRRMLENYGAELSDFASTDYDEEQEPYINTIECPNCIDGIVIDIETDDEDDCPVCQGSGNVLQTLGFEGLPVAEPLEAPEPDHLPASVAFIDYITRQLAP